MANLDSNWLISYNDIRHIWEHQPSFLIAQCFYLFGGMCTLKHAISNGGRWPSLWLIITIVGLQIELISIHVLNIGNYWHAQGPVMLFGKTLSLGLIFLYPCMYYTSFVSASRLRLHRFYESLMVGILTVLNDVPIEFIGIKYLHWSWHNTDPNILERNYWIPWNNYTFHFLFSFIISILFNVNGSIARLNTSGEFKARSENKISKRTLFAISLVLPVPILFISFGLYYHLLHDILGIHSQILFLLLFSVGTSIVWAACCRPSEEFFKYGAGTTSQKYIVVYLFLHYVFCLLTPVIFDPEKQISTGFHQPIGPCAITEPVHTLTGKVLQREKYLCWKNHSQFYFDFHCVPDFVTTEEQIIPWYTICGTPFENKIEYISIITGVSVVAFCIFKTLFSSRPIESIRNKERKRV